ncbi:MAG: amidohydrolase family protein [Halieaceae bacterium]|nr:amidohydrolase family protein [Halieaceae bacterium]
MALPEFVDAHHHLWDLEAVHYPWLMARGVKRFFGDPTPIQKNYLPEDFLNESAEYRPKASVHIQVGADDGLEETKWLHSLEDCPAAVVAFCGLSAPDVEARLDALLEYPKVRSIRQIVGRHADEDGQHGSAELLESKAWINGLKALVTRGLSFDLQMIPPQMPAVLNALMQVPDLKVALCHAGSPWDQSEEGLKSWRGGLEQLAALPNTVCKISGLGMFNPDWTEADLARIVEPVIDIFTPERVMFGSNFPVDKLYRDYAAYWQTYDRLTSSYSGDDRSAMFAGNAEEFYLAGI